MRWWDGSNSDTLVSRRDSRSTARSCCQVPCSNFPSIFAVGGDPVECCNTIERCGINTMIYALDIRRCSLIEIGHQKQQQGKIFALAWLPECKCSYLTVGGGCKQMTGCSYNLFTYRLVPEHNFEELALVTKNRFDNIITSMAWCLYAGCAALLVGSEQTDWECSMNKPFNENSPEIVLYKTDLCAPRLPDPLCCFC